MCDIDKIQFGIRVKEFRKRADLTQEELAELADLSKGQISNIERGHSLPELYSAIKISRALGTSIDYLCKGPDEENNRYVLIKFEKGEWEMAKTVLSELSKKNVIECND